MLADREGGCAVTAALAGTEHHRHASLVLEAALERPSHAYLFVGPPGVGKRTAARAFAAELLAAGSEDPGDVRHRTERGTHPDLTWVVPTGAHEIRVEDVREPVVIGATRTPFESSRRVFVIEQAELLNDQAANRLLKVLEEPAGYAHFILTCEAPDQLLATIASRCEEVRFGRVPAAAVEAALAAEGAAPETAAACARLAGGDLGLARLLASDEGVALRADVEALVRAALADELDAEPWRGLLKRADERAAEAEAEVATELAERLEYAPQGRERAALQREYEQERTRRAKRRAHTAALDLALRLAALWLRDLVAVAAGAGPAVLAVDRHAELERDAAGADPVRLRAGIALCEDARMRLELNVAEELALEALCYRLAAVRTC